MFYEYRRMTPEERQQVVQERLALGYPAHSPPHPYRGAAGYLITAANYNHVRIMSTPERRTGFERALLEALQGIGADVAAWVVLPNHYHVLLCAESLEPISTVLGALHGRTSREWNLAEGLTGRRRVWYHFSDRVIRSEEHYYRALNYVHYNPVKHGYEDDAYAWPWGSLSGYLETQGRAWLRDKWKAYPPDMMGQGWDD